MCNRGVVGDPGDDLIVLFFTQIVDLARLTTKQQKQEPNKRM